VQSLYRYCAKKEQGEDDMLILRKNSGFTMVEIIVVIVIISIAAMLAVPMFSSAADMQTRSVANMITADIEYAKSLAVSTQLDYCVVFDVAGDSYRIQKGGSVIDHPYKSGGYIVALKSDSRISAVSITAADFDSQTAVSFDYLGSPYSGTNTVAPLNSGQVSLQAGDFSMTVTVEPVTGYITIQ
jgi:prepilin-type N-terminal cleavage/methylation domain-containing protein